ncbi:MAG: hypothetical protein AAFX78_17390 [Cyanobacteria bacterium J06638_20]
MNYFLEYLRYLLIAVGSLCILPLLVLVTRKAFRRSNRLIAYGLFAMTSIMSVVILRFAFGLALLAIVFGPPASETDLIAELKRETGVQLPENADVISYRTGQSFFGYWSGFLKAEVDCRDLGQLGMLSGTIFDSQTYFDELQEPRQTEIDVWRRDRFTIPVGSNIVEYNRRDKQTIYAIDADNCAVYYHRFEID